MSKAYFFSDCIVVEITGLPCWLYGYLTYKGKALYFCWDPLHVRKRIVEQLRSGVRIIRLGDIYVFLISLVWGGLGLGAAMGRDNQSDADAAQVQNPLHARDTWDDLGNVYTQLLDVCSIGSWTCSKALTMRQGVKNCFFCCYSVVIKVRHCMELYGKQWQEHSFALQTVRN